MSRRASTLALIVGLLGCADPPVLDLRLVLPEGDDPLAGVDRLRVVLSDPPTQVSRVLAEGASSLLFEGKFAVEGAVGTVVLEGLAAEVLIARGETPPLVLRPRDLQIGLLVTRAGEMAPLAPRLPAPGREMMRALMPALGVLLAGGLDAEGRVLADAALYDFFDHQLRALPALPGARGGGVAASCGEYCAVVALGLTDSGLSAELWRFDGSAWEVLPDGLEPIQRRHSAVLVALDDGRYLVAGGEGSDGGALASLLALDPQGPGLAPLAGQALEPRLEPAVAFAGGAVLLAGGQRPGGLAAELYLPRAGSAQPLTLPGPELAGDSAATSLADGRIALIGGRGADGTPLGDGWIVDPVTRSARHLPGVLATPRAGHTLTRMGEHLVLVGGRAADGLAGQTEVLSQTLSSLAQAPMAAPREGHRVARLSPGTLLVVGGSGDRGQALSRLELYQTFAR